MPRKAPYSAEKDEMPDTLSFQQVIDLLNRAPELPRTLEYIIQRGCHAYPPFGAKAAHELQPWVNEHQRRCFNCDQEHTEHEGACWGNFSCEIWTCSTCTPVVREALQKEAQARASEGEQPPADNRT